MPETMTARDRSVGAVGGRAIRRRSAAGSSSVTGPLRRRVARPVPSIGVAVRVRNPPAKIRRFPVAVAKGLESR